MKLNKLIIITLILFTLICIPISFASELDVDLVDSSLESQTIGNIDSNVNLEDSNSNSDYSGNDCLGSDSDLNSDKSCLGSDIIEDNPNDYLDDSISDEDSEINHNDKSLNSENYNSVNHPVGEANTKDYNSPNLDTNFTDLNVTFTDSNTIFVNASYTGDEESGTIQNPFKTLYAAYNQFISGSNTKTNIFLANGLYQISRRMTINKNLNIVGESTTNTIISGGDNYQIFYISPPMGYGVVSPLVNIFNLTITKGTSYYGGAIYVNESGLNIVNVVFANNTAQDTTYIGSVYPGSGGAIYIDKAFVKIYNTTFINNKASGKDDSYGGALFNDMGETTIINSRFIENNVSAYSGAGGAIYDYSGILVLFNSSISNNTIYSNYSIGGGISNWASHNVYVLNSTIDGNRIYGNYTFGSAIINKANYLIISNTTISNNLANGTSDINGTFFNLNGIINSSNLQFENNIAINPQENLFMCLEDQLILEKPFSEDDLRDLPSKYDLRDYGWVTSVKDQGGSGSCWAFTTIAAMESYLLKYENVSYDFSENNMKNLMGYYGLNGTDWPDGGNYYMALAYLLRWSGPIDEALDPFDDTSHSSKSNLNLSKHVQDVLFVPVRLNYLDIDQIKAALMKYGALYTSINADSSFQYNPDYYLDIISISNHAITIIGWDDNYSADNFAVRPPGDGAFIIKNSWGTDHGYDGYWYISYYDKSFAGYGLDTISAMAISNMENVTNYKTIYQYDILGNTFESIGFSCSTAWFANEFTAKNNNPLSAFGLYTYGDSSYLVNITVNGVVKHIQEGFIKGAGYHTIKLDDFVELTKNDVFRVAVKLTTPISLFPVAIEAQREGYSSGSDAEEGQSFISPDGINWYDLTLYSDVIKFYQFATDYSLEKPNVCLKAYASGFADVFLNVKSNTSVYYKGDTVEITLTISNEGDSINDVNVSTILDYGASIKSVEYYKGSFDFTSKVWHLDSLNQDESVVLKLKLSMNQIKDIFTVSFNFTYPGFMPHNLTNSTKLELYYGGLTKFLQVENISTKAKSEEVVLIQLLDWNSTPIGGKTVVISLLEGENNDGFTFSPVSLITDADGYARFILNLTAGDYKFLSSFNGIGNYSSSNMTFNVSALRVNTELKVFGDYDLSNISAFAKSNDELKFYLLDENSKIIKDKTILLFNNELNESYNLSSDGDGYFKFNLDLIEGTYNFDLNFVSDDVYNKSDLRFTVNVLKKDSPIISLEKDLLNVYETLRIFLKGADGKGIANKQLEIFISGSRGDNFTLSASTDDNGVVEITDLSSGSYDLTVLFKNDEEFKDASLNTSLSVKRKETQIVYQNMTTTAVDVDTDGRVGKYFHITLKDKDGKPLARKLVQIGFNGNVYDRITDDKGQAKLQINLKNAGTYTFAVAYLGDDGYNGSFIVAKIVVNKQKGSLTVPAKSYKASAKTKTITATFKSASGKAVKGKKITFTVNGKTYTATTDAKGVAKVNVSLNKKGTYSFTAKFAGNTMYAAISKSAKLTLK
ncbi:lectin like domain-containing protein [Methanobrevibacter sp.]